ncbi:MAG: hypothetical protein RI932_2209 [Pseudomonadota bacterium]|jgi:hypothetical protein
MKAKILRVSMVFALLFTSTAPWSADAAPKGSNKSLESSKSVKYKKKTEVNFDDATIEGSVRTPFGQGLGSRDQNFKNNFIKVRKHFHDQMLMSSGGLAP